MLEVEVEEAGVGCILARFVSGLAWLSFGRLATRKKHPSGVEDICQNACSYISIPRGSLPRAQSVALEF